MKDWRAPQNASRVSTAALKPALQSLMVLTKATGLAGALSGAASRLFRSGMMLGMRGLVGLGKSCELLLLGEEH